MKRSSGVLLHVTSLPGGRLGIEARRFIDLLSAAGVSWWQVLSLFATQDGSPFMSESAFAANTSVLARPDAKVDASHLNEFRRQNRYWLDDWADRYGPEAMADQLRFMIEWWDLRRYALMRGIRLMVDLPFYVARGSVDHEVHNHLFRQDDASSGAPGDDFAWEGQWWGHPLYSRDAMISDGFRWYRERFRRMYQLGQLWRADYWPGYFHMWRVPKGKHPLEGHYIQGPGAGVFEAGFREFGRLPIVAEDLGIEALEKQVRRMRNRFGFMGMLMLELVHDQAHQWQNHGKRKVACFGTHDTPMAIDSWAKATEVSKKLLGEQMDLAGIVQSHEPHWDLNALALSSAADLAIIRMQDIVGEWRPYNVPGTCRPTNWSWQLGPDQFNEEHVRRLLALNQLYRR